MKNFKTLLPVLIVTTLVLSGCINTQSTDEDPKNNLADLKDQQFLTTAYTENSLATCDLIKNEELLQDCKINVEASILLQDAKQQGKKELCGQIKVGDLKQSCEIYFTEQEKKNEKLKEEKQQNQQESNKAKEIIKNNNIDDCKNLSLPYNLICYDSIIDNQAVEKNDPTICEKHSDSNAITQCKEIVKINQEASVSNTNNQD